MDQKPTAQAVQYAFRFGRTLVEFRHYAEFLWFEAEEDAALPDSLDTIVGELIDLTDRLAEGEAACYAGQGFKDSVTKAWQRFRHDWQSPLHCKAIKERNDYEPEDWLAERQKSLRGSPLTSDEWMEVDRKAEAILDEFSPLVRACINVSRTITMGSHVTVSDPMQAKRFDVSERRYVTVELNRELQVALADLWQCLPRSVELNCDLSRLYMFEAISCLGSLAEQLPNSVAAVLNADVIGTSHEHPPTALVQPEAAVDPKSVVMALVFKLKGIKRYVIDAYLAYLIAEEALSTEQHTRVTDPQAYKWLKQGGRHPKLPSQGSFVRYVGRAREALGTNKYARRFGRVSRGSVQSGESEYQERSVRRSTSRVRVDMIDPLVTLMGDLWFLAPDQKKWDKAVAILDELGATPEQITAIMDRKDTETLAALLSSTDHSNGIDPIDGNRIKSN